MIIFKVQKLLKCQRYTDLLSLIIFVHLQRYCAMQVFEINRTICQTDRWYRVVEQVPEFYMS